MKLADWLEIWAVSSGDGNSSSGDLETLLRRASLSELDDDDAIERTISETFSEISLRTLSAAESYPFDQTQGVLQLRSQWQDFPAYLFCLCLSYFGVRNNTPGPSKWFEEIACVAAKRYLNGACYNFGWPRKQDQKFQDAVSTLCKFLGEGQGYRQQPALDRKDDKVDLVAWIDFKDALSSKMIMFGQCASGNDWEDKLGELNSDAFLRQWIHEPLVSPNPTKSFFTPHRVGRTKWDYVSRRAGVFFDRCRISCLAHGANIGSTPMMSYIRACILS